MELLVEGDGCLRCGGSLSVVAPRSALMTTLEQSVSSGISSYLSSLGFLTRKAYDPSGRFTASPTGMRDLGVYIIFERDLAFTAASFSFVIAGQRI